MTYPFLQAQENLYSGTGLVYTGTIRCEGKIPFVKSVTKLMLEAEAEIGRHRNDCWEIYFSKSMNVRFNHHERWRPFVIVRPGCLRSIQNKGLEEETVYAIKF